MGDDIRRIAKAYFDGANEEEKNEAKEFFRKLDPNGDGKISLAEFKKVFNYDKIFNKLDSNHDGALYFSDVLVLFYYKKGAIQIQQCDGCGEILNDPYFTCFKCLPNFPHTYDLCCSCYRGGQIKHDHPLTDLLHAKAACGKFIRHAQIKSETDGIRRIASAYYERASEDTRNNAKAFFRKLDSNGDGKISLAEYKENVKPWLSGEEVFKKLDSDGDGSLDYSDTLVLFFDMIFFNCNDCSKPIFGTFFTCFLCLDKYPKSYNLCCECFRGGKYQHEHPLCNLYDDQYALCNFVRKTVQEKSEMAQLGEIARAHHRVASPKVQELAKEFFNSIDTDGDGKVDLSEFLNFMKQQGYWNMRNPQFFKELDKGGNGTLGFWEVMTLYYIIKSGRPFCDMCGEFIPGIFFSCVKCLKGDLESSFILCRRCYQSDDCKHDHGLTQFLDNYALLQALWNSAPGQATKPPMKEQATSSSTAVVLASSQAKINFAFKALDSAIAIANIVATNCTIL